MGTNTEKRFHPLYLLAAAYVLAIYLFPFLWLALNKAPEGGIVQAEDSSLTPEMILPLLIPGVLGLVNLGAVLALREHITREQLLYCAIIIKYGLIPFFIVGGGCIALTWLLTFSPVVIMIFIGPVIVALFSVLGYISMLGSAPFSIAYLIRSKREAIHHPLLLAAGGIMQFFFTLDTLSLMVLALKEKKCVKATIVMAVLLILAFLVLAGMLIFKIVEAAAKS